ncbi:MAG: TatD family hydrolase, partial [Oxalobacter sp.]|nr:TatD family hydrolase [Oxalobacter sp.]
MWIDTHCHLNAPFLSGQLDSVMDQAQKRGVSHIVIPAIDKASVADVSRIAHQYPNCSYALGIHPIYVPDASESDLAALENAVQAAMADPRFVAIGEIGLDYYYDNSPRDLQKKWFRRQIELAKELNLPYIVHDRDAHQD